MKKLVSILLSVLMVVAACLVSLSALAADPVVSPSFIPPTIITEVNGKPNKKDVTYTQDKDNPRVYTFTYTGKGNFKRWEFPDGEEGKDYRIISDDGKTITVELLTNMDQFTANAIVEDAPAPSLSPTSPPTGAAAALGVAAMGAGAAILAAVKRRKND